MWSFTSLIAVATALTTAGAITPITTKGNAFFAGDQRFYMRGVDYQPGGSSDLQDPLADPSICNRDIEYFQQLNANTIRVYTVDNTQNHDECMAALEAANIYLVLDVNTPDLSLHRTEPWTTYNEVYLKNVFTTVEQFSKYPNVLGFFSGNEVINDDTTTPTAPYIKAVTRDIKKYIKAHADREIPVGYSAADIESNRLQIAQYMACGDDEDAKADFHAVNDYSWCGNASLEESGWDKKVETYSGYPLPIFLSEFGCNEVTPRPFTEVDALFSTDMSSVFSGGLVYEYSEEPNNYGLVQLDGDSVTPLEDFTTLQGRFEASKGYSGDGGYSPESTPCECPAKSDSWQADNTLPEMPAAASGYLVNGVSGAGSSKNSSSSLSGSSNTTTLSNSTETSATATPSMGTGLPYPSASSSGFVNVNSTSNGTSGGGYTAPSAPSATLTTEQGPAPSVGSGSGDVQTTDDNASAASVAGVSGMVALVAGVLAGVAVL